MAKKWKAGDYIPIAYINALEEEVEKLKAMLPKKEQGNVSKDKG